MNYDSFSSENPIEKTISLEEDFAQFNRVTNHPLQIKEEEEDNDGQETNIKEEDKLTLATSSMQISKAILGTTILCLPSVFHNVGIVFGSSFLLLNGIISAVVVDLLLKCKDLTRKYGYSIYGKITMGSYGTVLVKLVISINNLGMCCCYFKILGELINILVSVFFLKENQESVFLKSSFYSIICFCILFPLIVKDNVQLLKKASIVGIGGVMIFFIAIVLIFLFKLGIGQIEPFDKTLLWPQGTKLHFFSSLPALFLAFSFHFNVFPIYASLKEQSNSSMMKSTSFSVIFTYVIYTLTGILGYLMYPSDLNDLIINNFKKDIIKCMTEGRFFVCFLISVVIIAFIVSLLFTIPLVFIGTKKHFLNLVLFTKRKYRHLFMKGVKITRREAGIVTVFLYCLVLLITLSVDNVMLMFNFIGSTTSCSISFILPAIFLLKLFQLNRITNGKVICFIVLIMGLLGLLSFYLTEFIKLFVN